MHEIVQEDVSRIREILKEVLGYDDKIQLERLGGLTNRSYKVTLQNGEIYAIRLPGRGTEKIVVREEERISTELACQLGLDAELLYFGKDGVKLSKYIENADTMSSIKFRDAHFVAQAAAIMKKLHSSNVNTGVHFDVLRISQRYEDVARSFRVPLFPDQAQIDDRVLSIDDEIRSLCSPEPVPCHNDPLCENWVRSGERLYLIDWEYAGMNDPFWDLADFSLEAELSEKLEMVLLTTYFDGLPDKKDQKRYLAGKINVDYLWSLWAKTRVPYEGMLMQEWAEVRYMRLKQNLRRYDSLAKNL